MNNVSIPSRGSGKGDPSTWTGGTAPAVSIPSRGSGKGDETLDTAFRAHQKVSIPSRGSGKGDPLYHHINGKIHPTSFNPLSGKW